MKNESLCVFYEKAWHWRFEQINEKTILNYDLTVADIMGALCCLSAGNLPLHDYSVRYLHLLLQCSFYLVRNGAIYPQVFWIGKEVAQIRWLPATMLPEILSIVADLEVASPKNFAFSICDDELIEILEPTEHLLSLFIGQLLRFARIYKTPLKTNHGNLLSFFFDCISGKFKNNAHSFPLKIKQWFSVYSSLDFCSKILFSCNESNEGVSLEIFILDNANSNHVPLADLFEKKDVRLLSILNILNGIAENFKPLNLYLKRQASSPIILRGRELLDFLNNCLKKLNSLEIKTDIPKSLLNINKPKPQMRLQGNLYFRSFSASDLLDFNWEVAIGNENASAKEFLELAEKADGLLKYKSQYVEFSKKDLDYIRNTISNRNFESTKKTNLENKHYVNSIIYNANNKITQAKLIQACFTGECNNVPVEMADDFKKQFGAWRAETDVALPENLKATLRPYQIRGYSWMYKNLEIGLGCILADDMGLGKTLQVIAFLLKIKQEKKFDEHKAIVVMPAGLLCNWQMEIKKFAPELTFFAYHGSKRNLKKFNSDILLTTYATFRKDFDKLHEIDWQVIIIDEAQNIKNAHSKQSRLLREIQAPMKIAMTGTPVENRLMEFWTIMDFTNKGFFPSAKSFQDKYETPIQRALNKQVAETFRKITAPFLLRRLKTDKNIISDLPEKITQNDYTELTKIQAEIYNKILLHFLMELKKENELCKMAYDSHTLFKRKGIILQMILALKQICNHPATFFKGTQNQDWNDDTLVNASGKLQMLLDLLSSIQEQNEKMLIFTQFIEMGNLLKKTIEKKLGLHAHFYHGGCSQIERTNMLENFQSNPQCKVLILSLKAGGTGLNLTAASQIIHYDLWWNPAIEAQATDRAFRIGQTQNVQVHRFITKGSFEEKINALLESKKALVEMTVNAGETWLTDMSDKELIEVFRLESTPLEE